jgi:hypothetical protein
MSDIFTFPSVVWKILAPATGPWSDLFRLN